jgi:hypothetical protein
MSVPESFTPAKASEWLSEYDKFVNSLAERTMGRILTLSKARASFGGVLEFDNEFFTSITRKHVAGCWFDLTTEDDQVYCVQVTEDRVKLRLDLVYIVRHHCTRDDI